MAGRVRGADEYAPWSIHLGDLDRKLGIVVLEQSAERVVATMPVEGNTQSLGLLHGGASLVLGEALGSWAALIHASTVGRSCVGVDINATHHRSVTSGVVTGVATAITLGRTLASHEVVVSNEAGERLCTVRITNLIVDREPMPPTGPTPPADRQPIPPTAPAPAADRP